MFIILFIYCVITAHEGCPEDSAATVNMTWSQDRAGYFADSPRVLTVLDMQFICCPTLLVYISDISQLRPTHETSAKYHVKRE